MIVKYVSEREYKGEGKDPYLTLDKSYIVVDITYNPHSMIHNINLPADNDGDPIVLEPTCLDFIDERVPDGWVFRKLNNGYFDLQPQEFGGDFWDDFHDGKEEAEKVYRDVVNKIYAFHGMEPFYKPDPPKLEPLKENEWWKEYDEEGNK